MSIALSCISYSMYIDVSYTPIMVVVFVIIYNAFFGYSWGPIPWLYPPEILPLSIRAKGASLSTATNWAFNWLVGQMTPVLQDWISWRLYLLHAFFCALSFILVYFCYPETKGVQLEDMVRLHSLLCLELFFLRIVHRMQSSATMMMRRLRVYPILRPSFSNTTILGRPRIRTEFHSQFSSLSSGGYKALLVHGRSGTTLPTLALKSATIRMGTFQ